MNQLRSWLFALVFYGLSVPIVLAVPIPALFGRGALRWYAHRWTALQRWCARYILGIRVRVEGAPLDRPALYAGKHQSMFETLELARRLDAPAVVLKRELANIPVWGWAARRYGTIPVDRAASAKALRAMMRDARAALGEGRSVLIFPEGTRVAPGEQPPLRSGFAGLYRALDLPVVPVAVDTGRLWPRKGAKRPGIVTMRFGEPIPPGLPRREVEARVHAAINVLDGDVVRRG
ncbi:lysophospholipid acyltransferase family protein [Stakelama sediminis]|uniref:1-acyl-sn-glycerol-3-phosphate acyltransferase n=1 Tax=Stakelama sediminis TaxID=463200 RepID=A0A840Z054_9SPHN|nr:lysophospholipid acyltransferase family protein [Stakelama sediminis]MBB5719112.1 1-acyl-sn-glycerol-3-phosphate acyltransferase [Stakelama sediminis]